MSPDSPRAEDFEPHVGSDFDVVLDQGRTTLRLAVVNRYPRTPHAPRTDPFGLLFTGTAGLDQGIHRLEHPALGQLLIFLVPIIPERDGVPRYEAIFN